MKNVQAKSMTHLPEEEQHCDLNEAEAPLRYCNSEGYSDPTAFFALRNAMRAYGKKAKPSDEMKPKGGSKPAKKRHSRTQAVHYD